METITVFDNAWYSRMIEQTIERYSAADANAAMIAAGIMTAGVFVAEAIERTEDKKNTH